MIEDVDVLMMMMMMMMMICLHVQLSNDEMFWVITEICSEQNIARRAKIIKHFIQIASDFLRLLHLLKLANTIMLTSTITFHMCLYACIQA